MTVIGILDALLQLKYREAGYSLREDEDFLYLCLNGKVCATFSTHGATIPAIEACIEKRGEVVS